MEIGGIAQANIYVPQTTVVQANSNCTDCEDEDAQTKIEENKVDEKRIEDKKAKELAADPLKDPNSEESKQVEKLKARDREVRTHEQAHLVAAGSHARGGASFTYQTGPNGQRYAIGGEVSIDTSAIKDNPEATLQKLRTVRAAALAPASPSGQDRAVAAQASQAIIQATQDLVTQEKESVSPEGETSATEEDSTNSVNLSPLNDKTNDADNEKGNKQNESVNSYLEVSQSTNDEQQNSVINLLA